MFIFLLLLLYVHDYVHIYLSPNDCIAGGCLWAVGALLTFLRSIQVQSSASFFLLLYSRGSPFLKSFLPYFVDFHSSRCQKTRQICFLKNASHSMRSHSWGPFNLEDFWAQATETRSMRFRLSFSLPPDWADVPADRTDHHLHELHDDGRLCLPLHLRHRLHQLHPLHCLRLRCLRWGQARAIFKYSSISYLTNDYNASFTWSKSLIQTWFNDAITKN